MTPSRRRSDARSVPERDSVVTELERSPAAPDTFDRTASRTGVIMRNCLARMIVFHNPSNFFHPTAYAKCFTWCLTVPCVKDAAATDDQR